MQNIRILPKPFRFDFYGKTKYGLGFCLNWLREHEAEVDRYLEENWDYEDNEYLWAYFIENPKVAFNLINDIYLLNAEKIKIILNHFQRGKSKIVMIIGARDSGKTAEAFWIAEKVHNKYKDYPIYSCSPKMKGLPKWVHTSEFNDTPNNTFVITDEAGILYAAREHYHKEHILLTKLMAIARHRNQTMLFMTQHPKLADINISRLADIILWKKQSAYLADFDVRAKFFNSVRRNLMPRKKSETLFEYPMIKRFIKFNHKLPLCWNEDLSKGWKDYAVNLQLEKKKIRYNLKEEIKKEAAGQFDL